MTPRSKAQIPPRNKAEIEQILKDIQRRLDLRRQATGLALKVMKDAYAQDDGWLQVVVTPTKKGVRAYDYVEALSEVEKELRREGIENVILVPALVD